MNKNYKTILAVVAIFSISLIGLFFLFRNEQSSFIKKYDSKTKETTTLQYILKDGDTIFHGKFICYNEKGHKTSEGNFVNGHLQGKCIYYFDSGIIESIYYYKNSEIIEQNIDNFPSGKIMRYTLYDDLGMSAFIIRFDEKGNVENYKGYPIMEVYQDKTKTKERFKIKINKNPKTGDTLQHQYLIADIPNAKRNFKIENIGVDDAKAKRTFKKTSRRDIDVEEILTKKGINTIRAVVKYEFNDNKKTVINDTVSFKVEVH
ncbi:hypothetical protein [Flavobacterium sp.]|uniref:hypothetical protein n=1 Tax=Flavobacterium sp. TaxID=239 RepID=UPI003D09E33E